MTFLTTVSVAPLRATASHRAEMVSQLLFGELCDWIATDGDFVQVKCRYDGYEGWVQQTQLAAIETGLFDRSMVCTKLVPAGVWVNGRPTSLSPGCECYFKGTSRNEINRQELLAGAYQIAYSADLPLTEQLHVVQNNFEMVEHARAMLGTPYLWGGKSIWGIDCSGLVQTAFKMAGMFLPRDAWQQAEGGDLVSFLQEAKQGDLAFFDNPEGRITHVGILLNEHEILHASGVVRIDRIDNFGIMNIETGVRTHTLRIIKRFF